MVFHADIAVALILIALGVGFWVITRARSQDAANIRRFGTFLGYFIVVVSFLTLLFAGYYTLRYWGEGQFSKPVAAHVAEAKDVQRILTEKVNLNTASKTELMSLPGIGPSIAERIIIYRDEHGHFKKVEDITKVKGIGKATLGKIRDLVTL